MTHMVNNWISIEAASAHRLKVEVRFGEITTVKNVPDYQGEGLASMLVVSAVRRYINHRYEILHRHGGHLTQEKKVCLHKLRLAFHRKARFKLEELPRVLKNWTEALFTIRPGRSSKYYERDIALLADLVAFADYYTRHPFTLSKTIEYAV